MSLADLTYLDGKGIIIGLFVGIFTVEIYRILKEMNCQIKCNTMYVSLFRS